MSKIYYSTLDNKIISKTPDKKAIKKMLKSADKKSRNKRAEKLVQLYKNLECVPDDIYKAENHNFKRIEQSMACGVEEYEFLSLFGTLESLMNKEIGYQYTNDTDRSFSDRLNEYQETQNWDESMNSKVSKIYQSKGKRNPLAHGMHSEEITQDDITILSDIVFNNFIPRENAKAKKKAPKWLNAKI